MSKQTNSTNNGTTSIVMRADKDCKSSRRFVTDDPKAPITNVYVSRALAGVNEAAEVTVTIKVG